MSQQINLYNPAFIPPRELVTPKSLAVAVAAALVLVMGGGIWARYSAARLEQQLAALQLAQKEAQAAFDSTTKAMESRQPNVALKAQVDAERAKVALRERVLAATHAQLARPETGFSGYLEGLARQSVAGLWVTGLSISTQPAQLGLRGRTLQKEFVPDYVRRLNAEPVFAGKTFAGLDMTQAAKPVAGGAGATGTGSVAKPAGAGGGGPLEFQLVAARADPAEAKN